MAISHDTSTDGGTATATSLTFAHTCSGGNRFLTVAVSNNTADNTDYITGVTYGGVSMTQINSFRSPGQGGHELYGLIAPATGSNNVVISASSSVPLYGAAASYNGVLQTGQPEANNGTASDPTTSVTVNTTTLTADAWMVSSAGRKAGSSDTISAGTNTTARQVNAYVAIGDSNAGQGAPGSKGQTWNISGSTGLAVITAALAPAPVGGNPIFFSSGALGVG